MVDLLEKGSPRRGAGAFAPGHVPGPGFLLHPQGLADLAAQGRHADRFRLCRAYRSGNSASARASMAHDAAAHAAEEWRPGGNHHHKGLHALAAVGAVRGHRPGAGGNPPLPAPCPTRRAFRFGPRRTGKGVPPGGARRLRAGAGDDAEGAEAAQPRRSLHRRRQRQSRPQGGGTRGLPGVAPERTRAARIARVSAPLRRCAAAQCRLRPLRVADPGPGAGHGGTLRRMLPSHSRRPHRRHRRDRQGGHDPCAGEPDARNLRRDPGAVHRRRVERDRARRQGRPRQSTPAGSASSRRTSRARSPT